MSTSAICLKCRPFKIEDKEKKQVKPTGAQAAPASSAKTGFDSPYATHRLAEIEDDMRRVSTVNTPTMVAVTDATGDTMEAAIVFIRAGGNIHDAVQIAAKEGSIKYAHESFRMAMPDDWDAKDYGLYWDFVYMG